MKDNDLIFLDSNLWIYLSIQDDSDKQLVDKTLRIINPFMV